MVRSWSKKKKSKFQAESGKDTIVKKGVHRYALKLVRTNEGSNSQKKAGEGRQAVPYYFHV